MINDEVVGNTVSSSEAINQFETKKKSQKRVDINQLMSKIRESERKEKKESIFFFSLLGCVLVITGIIASL